MNGASFIDIILVACDLLRFLWFEISKSYENFSFNMLSFRTVVVSVKMLGLLIVVFS